MNKAHLMPLVWVVWLIACPVQAREYLLGPNGDVTRLPLGDLGVKAPDLHGIRAVGTTFRGADLRGANFRDANLRRAKMERTDLRGADLRTQRRYLRGTRLQGARFDEFTQLPEYWGKTHSDRIATAIIRGMIFDPTVESLDAALRLLDAPNPECDPTLPAVPRWTKTTRGMYRGVLPIAVPAITGKWRGEINNGAGDLEIRRLSGRQYLGTFKFDETGSMVMFTIWLESAEPGVTKAGTEPALYTNRAFVEWRGAIGAAGRGWILISTDQQALTGQLGIEQRVNGIDLTFIRR